MLYWKIYYLLAIVLILFIKGSNSQCCDEGNGTVSVDSSNPEEFGGCLMNDTQCIDCQCKCRENYFLNENGTECITKYKKCLNLEDKDECPKNHYCHKEDLLCYCESGCGGDAGNYIAGVAFGVIMSIVVVCCCERKPKGKGGEKTVSVQPAEDNKPKEGPNQPKEEPTSKPLKKQPWKLIRNLVRLKLFSGPNKTEILNQEQKESSNRIKGSNPKDIARNSHWDMVKKIIKFDRIRNRNVIISLNNAIKEKKERSSMESENKIKSRCNIENEIDMERLMSGRNGSRTALGIQLSSGHADFGDGYKPELDVAVPRTVDPAFLYIPPKY